MTFHDCVMLCIGNQKLVKEFNRLCGCSIGKDSRSVIERMIDQTTGHSPPPITDSDAQKFIAFVYECVWLRMPPLT